jgi:hypothetical protein
VRCKQLVDAVHAGDKFQISAAQHEHVSRGRPHPCWCCKDTARPYPGQCCHPAASKLQLM